MGTPKKPKSHTYYQVHMYDSAGRRAGILSSYFGTLAEAKKAAKRHAGSHGVVTCRVVRTTTKVVAEVQP